MINKNIRKPIYGVGINDSDCVVAKRINGKLLLCPFYKTWKSMLMRCYSEKWQEKYPTYNACTVCEEWLTFSNFRSWMDSQYWYMMQLDKDLLIEGNKVYSPESCIFVSGQLNLFTSRNEEKRGDYPIGVHFNKEKGKLQARCRNPFTKKEEYLGQFDCQNEAHKAWKARKHELSCQWADIVGDERLKHALRNRYL